MLLNSSVAAGIRLFQKFFVQYFDTDSEESGTPLLHGRSSREVGGEGGLVKEQHKKQIVKKIIIVYEVNREEN